MNLKLNPRLEKIASLLTQCKCLADIGTDHGYIPIYALQNGLCPRAIASDINIGPLKRAEEHGKAANLLDRLDLRKGPGLTTLAENEADTIVIAGMGGILIAEILENSPEIVKGASRLILQPMTAAPELREYLAKGSFTLEKEVLVREEDKLYNIFVVTLGGKTHYAPKELLLGKNIEAEPELLELNFKKVRKKLRTRLQGLESSALPQNQAIAREVEKLLEIINE